MSLNFGYIQKSLSASGNFLPLSGGTMDGDINMDDNKITNLGPPTINTNYTTSEHAKDLTVNGSRLYSVIGDALETADTKSISDVEINLSIDTADMNAGFFIHGEGLALFGQFNNLSGYLKSASITIIKPVFVSRLNNKLTSVQLKMTSETTPSSISTNISSKLSQDLTPGTYSITPLKTKFSNLRYIGFFFEGEDTIYEVQFTARIVLSLVS